MRDPNAATSFVPRRLMIVRFSALFLIPVFALAPLALAQESAAAHTTLKVGGGEIDVTLPAETMKLSQNDLLGWVRMCATSVARYYGRFPVPHLTLRISAGY